MADENKPRPGDTDNKLLQKILNEISGGGGSNLELESGEPSSSISELPNVGALTADDLFYVVDDPAGTPLSRSVTLAQLIAAVGGGGGPALLLESGGATELTNLPASDGGFDVDAIFYTVQTPGGTPSSRKIDWTTLFNSMQFLNTVSDIDLLDNVIRFSPDPELISVTNFLNVMDDLPSVASFALADEIVGVQAGAAKTGTVQQVFDSIANLASVTNITNQDFFITIQSGTAKKATTTDIAGALPVISPASKLYLALNYS